MRYVQKLKVDAPSESSARRARTLIEDALRTASIPGDSSRQLIVRMVNLGDIDPSRAPSAIAVTLEERLRSVMAAAVPADDPRAEQASAVYFHDEIHPFTVMAARIARGAPAAEWYWKTAVPIAGIGARPTANVLRTLVEGVAKTSAGLPAVVAFLNAVAKNGALEMLLAGLDLNDIGKIGYVFPALPANQQPAVTRAQSPTPKKEIRVAEAWATALRKWIPVWGPGDKRSAWIAAAALTADRPWRIGSPLVPREAAQLVSQVLESPAPPSIPPARATEAASPNELAPLLPQLSEEALGSTDIAAEDAPSALRPSRKAGRKKTKYPARANDPAADSAAVPTQQKPPLHQTDDTGLPVPTEFACLYFLVGVLQRLGLNPAEVGEDFAIVLLRQIGAKLKIPLDDPILSPLLTEEDLHSDSRLAATWFARVRRWLFRNPRIRLACLVRRPGRVTATATHVEIYLPLRDADIRIRRHGLDSDPGWVPWLGRVIHFHYR